MPYLFPVLISKGVSFHYPLSPWGISDVDLTIQPGTIHVIVGDSGAGKSTFAGVLTGVLEAASGTIHIQGQLTSYRDLKDPSAKGIRIVGQTQALTGKQTVADALKLEGIPTRFGLVDHRERDKRALGLLSMYGLSDVDPSSLLCSLSRGKQKLVEFASVASKPCSLLILDDPTATLTSTESQVVYERLGQLRFAGAAILFLTTRPEEALEVADLVSVMREGHLISSHDPDEVFAPQIAGEMLGKDVSHEPTRTAHRAGPEVVMRVEGLNVEHRVDGVCLKVKRGEVLGLLGLEGAGQSEVISAIGGILPKRDGEIYLRASALPSKIITREQALACGIGLIPDLLSSYALLGSHPGASGPMRALRSLNDSNPKKVALGSALCSNCTILLFDNPTRGLNIASRYEVYRAIQELSDQGVSSVVASTNSAELIRVCDRIAVMVNGRILRSYDRQDFSQDRLDKLLKTGK